MKNFKKALAFTLAEVLITLSILGVVAAITVPSLINKNEEKSTVAKVLKMYSTLSDALAQAEAENGPATKWSNSVDSFTNIFYKYLNITKVCEGTAEKTPATECFTNGAIRLDLDESRRVVPGGYVLKNSAILKDGTSIAIRYFGPGAECSGATPCMNIFFDTNGKKMPNRVGKDIFVFTITDGRVDTLRTNPDQRGCYKTSAKKPAGTYLNADYNGFGCADYIVKNHNMNYLH